MHDRKNGMTNERRSLTAHKVLHDVVTVFANNSCESFYDSDSLSFKENAVKS